MTFKKVFELSEKFRVKTAEFNRDEKFQAERERLSNFHAQMEQDLTKILNEMEGDLLTLKLKEYPKSEWKEFVKIFHQLIQFKKNALNYRPYENAQRIISLINDRKFRAQIAALNISIQHFLKNNQVDWGGAMGRLQQAGVNSLNKLQSFAAKLYTYMIENPLIEEVQPNIPMEARIIPDLDYKESGPEDITKLEVKK